MSKRLQTRITRPSSKKWMKQTSVNTLMVSTALVAGIWTLPAHAVPTIAAVVGEIEKITLNEPNNHWSGGVIVAGGQNIVIPKNLLMDLPANRLTLKQLYDEASLSCKTQAETGLAKGDKCNKSGTGGIATIHGTRLDNGNVIAGDVFVAKAAETVIGQVTYINYDEGYFRVNGNANGSGGIMVRLNDPESRHTIQSGAGCKTGSPNCSPDPRFTLDGDNYTNVFSTGYPLCIPSTVSRPATGLTTSLNLGVVLQTSDGTGNGDVLCPRENRPANNTTPVADSRRFAPILVGDNITAEGNFETVNNITFLSAHSTMVGSALSTDGTRADQPDYLFLDEVEIDVPGFQNQRARTLIIGYATLAPADVMIWGIHYDPVNNAPHEFPLATSVGCDNAAGVGQCTSQGLTVGAAGNIFKIRHDVDFAAATKPKADPCAHLRADPRFADVNACSQNAGSIAEQFAILSPIPREIQARTGRKFAAEKGTGPELITVDINGNKATNGQYLFPFGMGLGGISTPEMNEINLDAMATPLSFTGIPWNLDRRLSPGGCEGACESTPQPLEPFPFEGIDPRTQANLPSESYNDPNFVSAPLNSVRDRILSYVNPTATRPGSNGIGINDDGNFTTALLDWQANSALPTTGPGSEPISPTPDVDLGQIDGLICSNETEFNSPPEAYDDSTSTDAGASKTFSVLWNDSDANGGTLSVTGIKASTSDDLLTTISTTNGNTVELEITGDITFTPAPDFAGTDSFIYVIADGQGGTDTGVVTVTVNATSNNPPITLDDVVTVIEDSGASPIDVLLNDTDDNSGTGSSVLSIASVTSPAHGTVSIIGNGGIDHDQRVKYTPNANYNGPDAFSYIVADGQGGTATANVAVTVRPVNDAPVAIGESATVVSGTAGVINVLDNDSDIEGNALSIVRTDFPKTTAFGTVTTNGATLTYTAKPSVVTPVSGDPITYTVSDGQLTATATVTVKVIAPVVDVVGFTRVQYTVSSSEWRVEGTGSVPGKTITVKLGATTTGATVGTATVDTLGNWIMRIKPGINPGTATTITAWSSGNGKLTTIFTRR